MASSSAVFGIALISIFVDVCLTHSWIACTDFPEVNGWYYTHDKCRAWPRSGHHYTPRNQPFGWESGLNHNPTESQPCKTKRHDVCGYNAEHPMAAYYSGQNVVISHPTKNHANEPACNQYNNQDHGNEVYAWATEPDATTDPPMSEILQNYRIADLGVSPARPAPNDYPKPGFQNAPAYCENPDKAMATNNFTVPTDFPPGRYTFLWLWYFASTELSGAYATCWEADIYATAEEVANRPAASSNVQQEFQFVYDSTWGAGATGRIEMPPHDDKSVGVRVRFPFPPASISIWSAELISTEAEKDMGLYYLKQVPWQTHEAGFSLSYSSDLATLPCFVSAEEIETLPFDVDTKEIIS